MIGLILKRASASRLSGEWSEDDYRIRQKLAAGIGRVLINAQISAGYALTLRLRHLWYWYFWLTVVQKMRPGRGSSVGAMLLAAVVVLHPNPVSIELDFVVGPAFGSPFAEASLIVNGVLAPVPGPIAGAGL